MKSVFIDTERDQYQAIIQMGIAVFDDEGELKSGFEEFINTKRKITDTIKRLTKITQQNIDDAATSQEVAEEISLFLEKETGETGEIKAFAWGEDEIYVNNFYKRLNKKPRTWLSVENIQKQTMKNLLKDTKTIVSLERLCELMNVDLNQKHNALEDAEYTGRAYFETLKYAGENQFISGDLISKKGEYEIKITEHEIEEIYLFLRENNDQRMMGKKNLFFARPKIKEDNAYVILLKREIEKMKKEENVAKKKIKYEKIKKTMRYFEAYRREEKMKQFKKLKQNEEKIEKGLRIANNILSEVYPKKDGVEKILLETAQMRMIAKKTRTTEVKHMKKEELKEFEELFDKTVKNIEKLELRKDKKKRIENILQKKH